MLPRDFNAKIGADNTVYNKVTGLLKQNGKRFALRCFLTQLVLGGSIFSHKRIHKTTWNKSQKSDRPYFTKKFRRAWKDVKRSGYFIRAPSTDDDTKAISQEFNNTTNRTRCKASVLERKWGHHSTPVCPTDSSCYKTSRKTMNLTSRHYGNI